VSVHDGDHGRAVRMIVGLSEELYWQRKSDQAREQWQSTGRQKGSELHHQGEFLHNYYMFGSVDNSNRNGVVTISVALSCEVGGFFI